MIGLNRQIFRLNHVRTFFLSVSNTSPPKKGKKELPIIIKLDGTTTKGRDYKMATVGDNVRVMTVSDKTLNNAVVYWSIRVGVGYADDPDNCQGLAHLLEHVTCKTYLTKLSDQPEYDCETTNSETKFLFAVPFKPHAQGIGPLTEIMFSDNDIDEDIMTQELNRVDNEYHEKRSDGEFIPDRTIEILKQKKDFTLDKFGVGSRKTLSRSRDNQLIEALKEFRKLYRRRPLNVCVYSAYKIEMKDVIHSLEFDGYITKEERKVAKEPNWEERLKSVEAQHLIVLHSADDSIRLDIIYPFHKKLSLDEEDTFTIVGDLISKSFEGQLGHVLFEKKMATSCWGQNRNNSFVVTILLTADGLKRIRQVTSMVHDYFQFLRDNWRDIDKKPLVKLNQKTIDAKSNLEYADSIARCLGRLNDTFDEEDLFRPLTLVEAQQLISEQILNNKCIQHTIAARNVDDVYNTLRIAGLAAKGDKETEGTIGTQFRYLETGLFAAPSNFTLPLLSPKPITKRNEDNKKFPVFIIKAKDEAFLALCSHYLELTTAHLIEPHNLEEEGKYRIYRRRDGSIYFYFDRKITTNYSKLHPETEIDFKYAKRSLMEEYSQTMTDSNELARSLMQTALENVTGTIKRDSVPLQYNVLKDMDFSKYKHHFEELKSKDEIKHENVVVREALDPITQIKSINVDESNTVTLAFLESPVGTNKNNRHKLNLLLHNILRHELFPNLYNRSCSYATFGAAEGILLTLVSVEETSDQTGTKILKLLKAKINRLVLTAIEKHHPKQPEQNTLKKLWNEMRRRQIIIQIVGHVNGGYPSGPFQTHFEEWLKDHKEKLDRLNNS